MDFIGAIANTEDIIRLHKLELEGHFPPGYATRAMLSTSHYLERIIVLRILFAVIPYPGPIVTEYNQRVITVA